MNILAIETSCDETAAAILSGDLPNGPHSQSHFSSLSTAHPSASNKNAVSSSISDKSVSSSPFSDVSPSLRLLSNVVVSQIDIFKAYGGVIPEVAARSHLEAILPVIHQAFQDAGFVKNAGKNKTATFPSANQHAKITSDIAKNSSSYLDDWSKIDAIAVTHTPGLLGSLLIGTLTARTLAILHNKPLYAVHHLKSHIYANWLPQPSAKPQTPGFPLLALVVSGGHTQIIYMKAHNHFKIIGTTTDDAVGECFDKVAKILGLPYPGGPAIAEAAESGDPHKYRLPHPQVSELNFSFSGLKTAVLRAVQKEAGVPISYPSHQLAELLTPEQKADFAASFQETATDILLEKLVKALALYSDANPTSRSSVKPEPASHLNTESTSRSDIELAPHSAINSAIKSIVIAGGVSANAALRKKALDLAKRSTLPPVYFPDPQFSGDNAAMVAAAAFHEIASGVQPVDPYKLGILPRSEIS